MLERDTVEKLHRNEGLTVLLIDLVDSANAGMVKRRRCLRLALEAA